MRAGTLKHLMNWWPPFLGAGIHVETISSDFRHVRVRLNASRWRSNYVGTHFGGALFAMADPYWMIMVLRNLGNDYRVWDLAAEIDFLRAVREPVWAEFRLQDEVLNDIRQAAAGGDKVLRWMPVDIRTASGETIARVRKQIYVRRKPTPSAGPA